MSVNRYKPHVYVLPEDRANSALANGFHLGLGVTSTRQFQVLAERDGWEKVVETFLSGEVGGMDKHPESSMILLLDLDDRPDRFDPVKADIPVRLADRVFILGVKSEPEELKRDERLRREKLCSLEKIGEALAQECREHTDRLWHHDLLRHNSGELERPRKHVRPILFP